jgi:pyruvate dehydrogenase E2 component (dihydrolipoamide acetyltransferase)
MATKVHMEALSPTMEEGQIVKWLMSEGDEVKDGDVLAEIETDKATMELVARGSGVLRKQLLGDGETAAVGAVIGVIAGKDEDISDLLEEAPAGGGEPEHAEPAAGKEPESEEEEDVAEGARAVAAADKTERPRSAAGVEEAAQKPGRTQPATAETAPARREQPRREENGGRADDGRVKASPLARRLAAEAGLELADVRGSGPGGRITKRDIEGAVSRGETARPRPEHAGDAATRPAADRKPSAPPIPARADIDEVEELPVSQMRKTIAKRLVTSIGPVPTFYLTIDVDMSNLTAARERINERLAASGVKVSINDFLIRITAEALRRHPEVNAAWHDTVIRRYGRVHIGVAVAVDEGLITPVVRDADAKGVADIAVEVKELARRAREKKLQPDEYTGATFSISNLGMFGIEEFTAIINPPEAAILAVGAVEERVVVVDGDLEVQPRMKVTMSCDHRVVDGAMGARFLQTLKALLEEPVMVVV